MTYTEIRYLTFLDIDDEGEQAIIDTSNSPASPGYFSTDYHFKWCGTFFEVATTHDADTAKEIHMQTIAFMGKAVRELDDVTDESVYQYILERFKEVTDDNDN